MARIASAAITWPDSEAAHKGLMTCKALVAAVAATVPGSDMLVEVAGGEMFRTAIQGLTLVSNAGHPGEVVALVREILVTVRTYLALKCRY